MSYHHWINCPQSVKNQVAALVGTVKAIAKEQLVGVYLHGSLALGCFNPDRSDLDLLVVTHAPLMREMKQALIDELLLLSGDPSPIEISFLCQTQLGTWHYPTPYDLHYSEMWREGYQNRSERQKWLPSADQDKFDSDLAAHLTVLLARGITLYGKPAAEVFPAVPVTDYQAAILADYRDARAKVEQNPLYAVLTACRVYGYLSEKRILSKQEGARWGINNLPGEYKSLLVSALAIYQGDAVEEPLAARELAAFLKFINRRIVE